MSIEVRKLNIIEIFTFYYLYFGFDFIVAPGLLRNRILLKADLIDFNILIRPHPTPQPLPIKKYFLRRDESYLTFEGSISIEICRFQLPVRFGFEFVVAPWLLRGDARNRILLGAGLID